MALCGKIDYHETNAYYIAADPDINIAYQYYLKMRIEKTDHTVYNYIKVICQGFAVAFI